MHDKLQTNGGMPMIRLLENDNEGTGCCSYSSFFWLQWRNELSTFFYVVSTGLVQD